MNPELLYDTIDKAELCSSWQPLYNHFRFDNHMSKEDAHALIATLMGKAYTAGVSFDSKREPVDVVAEMERGYSFIL